MNTCTLMIKELKQNCTYKHTSSRGFTREITILHFLPAIYKEQGEMCVYQLNSLSYLIEPVKVLLKRFNEEKDPFILI